MIREFLKDTSGNIAVIFSVTVLLIIFAVAVAVDLSIALFERQDDSMIGTASGELTLFFGGVLPKDVLNIRAKSIAKVSVPGSEPCIIAQQTLILISIWIISVLQGQPY